MSSAWSNTSDRHVPIRRDDRARNTIEVAEPGDARGNRNGVDPQPLLSLGSTRLV